MFSSTSSDILFSKVHASLSLKKDFMSPISGYGPDAMFKLVKAWAEFKQLTEQKNCSVNIGYVSVYATDEELHLALVFIKSKINPEIRNLILDFNNQHHFQLVKLDQLIDLLASKS